MQNAQLKIKSPKGVETTENKLRETGNFSTV